MEWDCLDTLEPEGATLLDMEAVLGPSESSVDIINHFNGGEGS